MRRRTTILLFLMALSIGGIIASGAFSQTSAERGVQVEVAGDSAAYLALEPHDEDPGYARFSNGQLELRFDDSIGAVAGEGLNPEATTTFDDVFNITNQGTQTVEVDIEGDSSDTTYYGEIDGERITFDVATLVIDPGEVIEVGVLIETDAVTDDFTENLQITANETDETDRIIIDPGPVDPPDDPAPIPGDPTVDGEALVATDTLLVTEPTDDEEILGQTQPAVQSGVTLTEIDYSPPETDTEVIIQQSEGPPTTVPDDTPTSETILSHFTFDSTIATDEFDDVELVFELDHDVVENPDEIEVLRYSDQWDTLEPTVQELEDSYRVRVTASGFSTYAVTSDVNLFADDPTGPTVLDDIELFNALDPEGDGYLQNFDVDVEVDLSAIDEVDDPYVSLWLGERHLKTRPADPRLDGTVRTVVNWQELSGLERDTYQLRVDVRDGPLPTDDRIDTDSLSVQIDGVEEQDFEDIDLEQTAEEFHQDIRQHGQYENFSEVVFNPEVREDLALAGGEVAAEVLNDRIESMISPSLIDVGVDLICEGVPGGDSICTIIDLIDAATFAAGTAVVAEEQSTAIYLQETSQETTELREKLRALQANTEQVQHARNAEEPAIVDELLEQRKVLLEDLHAHLPEYVEAVHQAVLEKSVGVEDRRTYTELRANIDFLRTIVATDYAVTTADLTGSPASLSRTDTMPTHGWEREDRSVVYDTLAFPGDYAIYQVEVSEEQASEPAVLRVQSAGGTTADFDIFRTDDQPIDPAEATGEQFGGVGTEFGWETRTLEINESGEHYVVVRGTQGIGMYRIVGSTATSLIDPTRFDEAVDITPLTRADPPDTRPDLELEEHPDKFELEETGGVVYATDDSDIELVWNAISGETPPDEHEYRYRVDDGTGFTDLSDWKTASDGGNITLDPDITEGVNRVQVVVRNNQFMQTVDSVDIVKQTTEFDTYLTTDDDSTSNALFVKVLPDERIGGLELQYREFGDESWQDWKTVEETEDLGRLDFDRAGEFEIRARALDINDNPGQWDATTLIYTRPPTVSLVDAPPEYSVSSTGTTTQRFTDADPVDVTWEATSDIDTDLEYRVRVDDQSDWTEWQSVGPDGTIAESFSGLPEGDHQAELEVRDEFDQVTEDDVSFTVTRSDPLVELNGTEDVEQLRAELSIDQPVETLEFEYRDGHGDEWELLTSRSHVGQGETQISANVDPGVYDIRVRAVDYLDNVGSYAKGQAVSFEGETEEINETSSGSSGGTSTRTSTVDSSNQVDVNLVTGEMIVNAYLVTREVRDEHLATIELTEQGNQTLEIDAPDELLEDADGLELEVIGEGTVILDSLRAFDSELESPEISIDRDIPTVDEPVSLSVDTDQYVEGSIETVEWDLTGDGTVDETGDEITTAFESVGNQTVETTIVDTYDRSASSQLEVFVNAEPVIETHVPDSAKTLEEVTFDATETVDPTDTDLTFSWTITHSDGPTVIEGEGPLLTTSFDTSGDHTFTLEVEDEFGETNTTSEEFKINNRPPVAIANITEEAMPTDQPVADEPVVLTAENSFDPDGDIVQYDWTIAGESFDGQTVETILNAGEWSGSLTVTDDDGATNTTEFTIDVRHPPEVTIIESTAPTTSTPGSFEADAVTDPTGNIEDYQWFVDGEPVDGASQNLTYQFSEAGTYEVSVLVTDDVGAKDGWTTVTEVDPFEVDAEANQTQFTGQPIEFDGSDTIVPSGEDATFHWDFGDGSTAIGETVTHTYESAGNYTATLTVELERGVDASESIMIDVSDDEPLYYNLEEGSGTDLTNFVSGYPDGEIVGNDFEWQEAPEETGNEYSLQMGGSTYGETGITQGTEDLAIEMWFRHDFGSDLHYMWNDFEGGSSGFRMFTNGIAGNGIYVRDIPGHGDLSWSGNIQNDEWNHIVFVLDTVDSESRLYINGDRVETGEYDGNVKLDGLRVMGDGGNPFSRSTASYDIYSFTYESLDDDAVSDRYQSFAGT